MEKEGGVMTRSGKEGIGFINNNIGEVGEVGKNFGVTILGDDGRGVF